jgi:uncharacterized SAM-binding protein YcdF (DUF218 family)
VLRRLLLALLLAWAAAVVVLFVWVPFADDDPKTDAIVVLAGSRTRLPVALDLLARGDAGTLAVSRDPRDRARVRLCRRPPAHVLCFSAEPYSTRGEARLAARIARERGWRSLALVTSRFHLFRAGLIFRRCTDVRLELVPAPVTWWQWPIAAASESAKLAVAVAARRGC